MKLDGSIRVERRGFATLYLSEGVHADDVLKALDTSGDILKDGDKRIVRKVGDWVIKTTRMNGGIGPLKMTVDRNRYRNGWIASREMERLGLKVPRTIAYVEYRLFGIIWGNAFIYEYLNGCLPGLVYSIDLKEKGDRPATNAYFTHLADAVLSLANANVFHRDLKLNNVLTADGKTFYFIDLDEAQIGQPFKPEHRLRNHIQMANGLSRIWNKQEVTTFLHRTIPENEDNESWIARVWDGVEARRGTGEIH